MSTSSSTQPRSTKRKLDAQNDDDDLPSTRTRIDEQSTHLLLQFSVHMTNNETLVIRADPTDTVRSVYDKVESISQIRLDDDNLGLIYQGKQLRGEQTLLQCGVENDATLISADLRAWRLVNEVIALVSDLHNNTSTATDTRSLITTLRNRNLKAMLLEYLSMLQLKSDFQEAKDAAHLRLFRDSSVAAALATLYASPEKIYKNMADASIKSFVRTGRSQVPEQNHASFARIVLQFCMLLRERMGAEDQLYRFCRSNLADMTRECAELRCNATSPLWFKEVFPFVRELGGKLARHIPLSRQSAEDVSDLSAFLLPQRNVIEKTMASLFDGGPIRLPLLDARAKSFPAHRSAEVPPSSCREEVSALHKIFTDLLRKVGGYMKRIWEFPSFVSGLDQYLLILKELHHIAKLYHNADKTFGGAMKRMSGALNHLLKERRRWSDEDRWIFQHKEATSFETRRHLAMLMLRSAGHHGQQFHEMLIDRSQLLSDSFKYVSNAQVGSLRRGLFVQFKNEQAFGPGVVREWFALVCEAIFDPQRALYVACPADRRRFFPNRASEVDPLHLKYFNFSGRVMALALLHKIQVGIVLDRVFFKQLAGDNVTLEDIRDADPDIYSSCKQILEMDPEAVDQDVLGLTFAHEVEFLGARKVVELRPGGENIVVNSQNRKEYVDLLIRHLFAESISQQTANFAQGFAEIAGSIQLQQSFFQCLTVQDLDMMLYGSDKPICVDDWKAHTEYQGFVQSDDQISWFWEIVASMSEEQKKSLLFFWTSVKQLPVEGFKGLASKLSIYKSPANSDRLPASSTCFRILFLPSYPSRARMTESLRIITQDHVACSFGTG